MKYWKLSFVLILVLSCSMLEATLPSGTESIAPTGSFPAASPTGEGSLKTMSQPDSDPAGATPTKELSLAEMKILQTVEGALIPIALTRTAVWQAGTPTPTGLCESEVFSMASPSSRWVAILCSGEGLFSTFVIRADIRLQWELKQADTRYIPFHWSSEEKYLYLLEKVCPETGSCKTDASYFAVGNGLHRMEVNSGKTAAIYEHRGNQSFAFAFSGDGRYLAHILQEKKPLQLGVLDVNRMADDWIALGSEYAAAGKALWSPDGKKMILTAAMTFDAQDYPVETSVLLIDLVQKTKVTVIYKAAEFLTAVAWLGETAVLLNNEDDGSYWLVDVEEKTKLPVILH